MHRARELERVVWQKFTPLLKQYWLIGVCCSQASIALHAAPSCTKEDGLDYCKCVLCCLFAVRVRVCSLCVLPRQLQGAV